MLSNLEAETRSSFHLEKNENCTGLQINGNCGRYVVVSTVTAIHFRAFKRLLFSHELLYNHINFPPDALTVQTAKNDKESPFLHKRKLCHGRCDKLPW